MANLKFCPRCNENLIEQHEKYCDKCNSRIKEEYKESRKDYYHNYNQSRDDIYNFYNSKEWKIVRDRVKAKQMGLCLVCLANSCMQQMSTVHHIVPLKDDTALALNEGNLICVCSKCHSRIHSQYDKSNKDKEEMIEVLQLILQNIIVLLNDNNCRL